MSRHNDKALRHNKSAKFPIIQQVYMQQRIL